MEILEFPSEIKVNSIDYTKDDNNGVLESPWTGAACRQCGQLERWRVTININPSARHHAPFIEGFLMCLEGNKNVFKFPDCSRRRPLGNIKETITLKRDHVAGEKFLEVEGLDPYRSGILAPGDWLQIGLQGSKVKSTSMISADGNGCAKIPIFPKLWTAQTAGAEVEWYNVAPLYRLENEAMSFSVRSGTTRPFQFNSISAVQEVLYPQHPLLNI